ncbi:MAG: chromate transporter [Chloroflexi bacterium]|nr:chromate transporter [Chloroflexota bacterium]
MLDTPTEKTNPASLFMDWFLIGIQSFGGGSSTFSLVHQIAIKRGWLNEEEFVRAWALAQISPGINLVKLTVMIGYRLAGWRGIIASVSGLLLPSAVLTILMTSGFAAIRTIAWIQAMVKGILPAAIGLSFAMSVQMAHSIFISAHKEGFWRLGAHVIILLVTVLLMSMTGISPVIILLLSGIAAVALLAIIPVSDMEQVRENTL